MADVHARKARKGKTTRPPLLDTLVEEELQLNALVATRLERSKPPPPPERPAKRAVGSDADKENIFQWRLKREALGGADLPPPKPAFGRAARAAALGAAPKALAASASAPLFPAPLEAPDVEPVAVLAKSGSAPHLRKKKQPRAAAKAGARAAPCAGSGAAAIKDRRRLVKERRAERREERARAVLGRVEAKAAKRDGLRRARALLAAVAVAKASATLGYALSSCFVYDARLRVARALQRLWRVAAARERLRLTLRLIGAVGGNLRWVVASRVRRKRVALGRIRRCLRSGRGAAHRFRRVVFAFHRKVRVVQRAWRDFAACGDGRVEALRILWAAAVDVEVARERAECDALERADARARKVLVSRSAARAQELADERTATRKRASADAERARRFREIGAGLKEIKTRLKKADALVLLAHSRSFASSSKIRTARDALLSVERHAVPDARRDALLRGFLRDLRRRFSAASAGVAAERHRATVHEVDEVRSLLRGDADVAALVPRSKRCRTLPLFLQRRELRDPRLDGGGGRPPPPSPHWTAVPATPSARGAVFAGAMTPSRSRVWKMLRAAAPEAAEAAEVAPSLRDAVHALYVAEHDRQRDRREKKRDRRLRRGRRGVLEDPSLAGRSERSVTFADATVATFLSDASQVGPPSPILV